MFAGRHWFEYLTPGRPGHPGSAFEPVRLCHFPAPRSARKKGPRTFVLPGILKIIAVAMPAKKACKGINPFTGGENVFKAKPATVSTRQVGPRHGPAVRAAKLR